MIIAAEIGVMVSQAKDADTGQNLEAVIDRTFPEAFGEVCPNILISGFWTPGL